MNRIALILFAFNISFAFVRAQDMKSGGVLKPEQAIMDVRHYTVSLEVDPKQKTIDGFAEIDFILLAQTNKLLFDLTPLLHVKKIYVNGKETRFTHTGEIISIDPSSPLDPGKGKVKIEY